MSEKNFQKSQIVLRCKNCKQKCNIVYDSHHCEHYSITCGLVIMQGGIWLVHDYDPFIKWISIKDGLFY